MRLPSLGVVHIALALVFICNFQSVHMKQICKFHTELHCLEASHVLLPDAAFVEEPRFSFWYVSQCFLIEICKQHPGTDIRPRIFHDIFWIHHHKTFHLIIKILVSRSRNHRCVKLRHSGKCSIDSHLTVGLVAMNLIPFTAGKCRLAIQSVYLLTVTATVEC